MFSRTPWRIRTWDSQTVGLTIVFGVGGGVADIGLENNSTGTNHILHCAGASASLGLGESVHLPGSFTVSLPASLAGLQGESRTQGGTLYKNNLVIRDDLTLDDIRDSLVLVKGVELSILDEGQVGYLVMLTSLTANLSTFLAGGGLISEGISFATCRAVTFLSAGSAGLPSASINGYRYRIIGVT